MIFIYEYGIEFNSLLAGTLLNWKEKNNFEGMLAPLAGPKIRVPNKKYLFLVKSSAWSE